MREQPIDDGGPAFPVIPADYELARSDYGWVIHAADDVLPVGMSLRDHFAGEVLLGIFSCGSMFHDRALHDRNANLAYEMADAMLRARKAGGAA